MKKRILSIVTALMLAASFMPAANASEDTMQVIKLNPSVRSPFNGGEFEGWGTSLGWWGNRIGYSDKLAQQAADLFYSEEGLGLDIVRYNVGGGDDPSHNHVTRSDSKLPCFMNEDGSYNWDADYNQVNVLTRIKKANSAVHIEGYTNSPPWFMTETRCSGGGRITLDENGKTAAIGENLSVDNYNEFADFIADVTEHFEEIGLKFDSYSPMNEPDPRAKYWGEGSVKQEGNHVAPGEHQSKLLLALYNEYKKRGIDTLVVGPEETSIDYSIDSFNALTDEAKAALGRLDTHTYGGSKRAELKKTAADAGKNLWMSEVDNGGTAGTDAGDMGMALNLANRILSDMNEMQPSAWVIWDIIDLHKDAGFTAPDGTHTEAEAAINQSDGLWGVGMADHDNENIELTQKYYGYGQFTKYIRPGMTIVQSADNTLAAYDKGTGEIVIVAMNTSDKDRKAKFDLRDFDVVGSSAKVIRTSGSYENGEHWANLEAISVNDKMFSAELKANSITTYVIEHEPVALKKLEADSEKLSYSYSVSENINANERYLVIYDRGGKLKSVVRDKTSGVLKGDFTGCTAKAFVADSDNSDFYAMTDTVKYQVGYLSINGPANVFAGREYKYETASYESRNNIEWSVSDESAAEVSEDGMLKPLKGGIVTLTAKAEDMTTSLDITVNDYKDKYSKGDFKFIRNIAVASNDFTENAGGFVMTGTAGLAEDASKEGVLMVQGKYNNKEGAGEAGSAELTLNEDVKCESGQWINMSFDVFCPDSGGYSHFALTSTDGKDLVKIRVSEWGNIFSITIGNKEVVSDGDAKTYFKNSINAGIDNMKVSNGGHVEIFLDPSAGETVVTVKNNTNTAETKTYKGTVPKNKSIGKIYFSGEYNSWTKQMIVDNLVTNIIEKI